MQYAAPREGLERGRAQRAHRGADLSALLRQYLYFCTSKASKPSTCWRRAPWRSSAPRGEPAAVGTTRRRCASGGAAAPLAAPVFSTVARGQFHFFWHNMLGVNIACITSCVCIPRRRGNATGETAARLRRRRTCRPQTAPALEIYLQLMIYNEYYTHVQPLQAKKLLEGEERKSAPALWSVGRGPSGVRARETQTPRGCFRQRRARAAACICG